jgi:hypothetical protein
LQNTKSEYQKLLTAKKTIEESISDSKDLFQQLKSQLDSQEKEIRNKESRIHRLEVLSLIYRLSKFFGGILIFSGIFYLVWAIGSLIKIIDLGSFNIDILSWLLIIGAILAMISGFFHIEKS